MKQLPVRPTLADLQSYVKYQCEQRGWQDRSDVERILMLTEEVGEVAKEVRKHTGRFGYTTPESTEDLASELIDTLNWIIDIANSNNIELSVAFRKNWEKNSVRTWE